MGELKLNFWRSDEEKAQRARDKANLRDRRTKLVRFTDELTDLVMREAINVRNRRTNLTGFKWHVDHIVPLQAVEVSGLHIWSNLQVIPASLNLLKGNKHALHD